MLLQPIKILKSLATLITRNKQVTRGKIKMYNQPTLESRLTLTKNQSNIEKQTGTPTKICAHLKAKFPVKGNEI